MLENCLPEAAMVFVNMAPELPVKGGGAMKIAFFFTFPEHPAKSFVWYSDAE